MSETEEQQVVPSTGGLRVALLGLGRAGGVLHLPALLFADAADIEHEIGIA